MYNNTQIKIFILHHTPAVDRKLELQKDLNFANLPYQMEWVESFLPSEIDSNIFTNIKRSELSLSLKHKYALEQIVQNNIEYGIVFEDDVNLQSVSNTHQFLEQSILETKSSQGDVLWIGDVWVGKYTIPRANKTQDKISYFSSNCSSRCTHAYIISQQGARLVLDNYHYNQPIDHLYNEIISKKIISSGWTEPGLTQKSAENIWTTLI
jgi:hypothetical protein